MRIVCWQTILMKNHTFFRKSGKMSQNISSAAVVIGTLKVHFSNKLSAHSSKHLDFHWTILLTLPFMNIHAKLHPL